MMASRKKTNESSRSVSKNTRRHRESMFSSSSSSSEEEVATGCSSSKIKIVEPFARSRPKRDAQPGQDASRPDENPFSFKHFLKNGSQTNYSNFGARPKVYSSPTPSVNNMEKDSTVYSRNPTELPDFVQDHLVIEQWYQNYDSKQQPIPDIDNLPDFALNSMEPRQTRLRNESKKNETVLKDLSFDLTGSTDRGLPHRNPPVSNTSCSPHINLSVFDRSGTAATEHPESSGFPLDLPIAANESDPDSCKIKSNVAPRNSSIANDTNVQKSLPDFLNDGPIHNRTTLSTDAGSIPNSTEPTEKMLLLENERLRRELELARKKISEKSKRITSLLSQSESRKEAEHEETTHLEKAMEQVEDNLKRSTKRAVDAESTVLSLEKEIKVLTTEMMILRIENEELKTRIATGFKGDCGSVNTDRIRRLAGDLRTAASSAEMSLRQLMSGVDNLRVLASALENVDRIEDRTKDFLPDFDEDNATGPAL